MSTRTLWQRALSRLASIPKPVWLAGLGAGGVLAVLFFLDPARHALYPACTFRRWTGWNCPGCGGLRATHQLLHGHVLEALRLNALAVALWLGVAAWVLGRLWRWWRPAPPRLQPVRPLWFWLALVALLVFGVARNLPFAPFRWLSP